jgi:eukaryotic-like serine/threonine-protein kinase
MNFDADTLNDLDQLRSRYDVLRRLGFDGEYEVHAVRNPSTDRHYAVRIVSDGGGRSARTGALQLCQAHTVAALEHPKLMVVHAVHHLQGGAVGVAMERRPGRTLAERIETYGALPASEVAAVLRDVASALTYLHGRGVVHRGVRPASVFLDRISGHSRLGPFGIDRSGASAATGEREAAQLRAFAYLAPEQIHGGRRVDGRKVTTATDIYSLGLVAVAMLTGQQPWTGADLSSLLASRKRDALPSLRQSRPDVPATLIEAIEGCLSRDPRQRWRSAEELAAALETPASRSSAGPRLRVPHAGRLGPGFQAISRLWSVPAAGRFRAAAIIALVAATAFGAVKSRGGEPSHRESPTVRGDRTAPVEAESRSHSSGAIATLPTLEARPGPPAGVAEPVQRPEPREESTPSRSAPRPAPERFVLLGEPVSGSR